MKKYASEIKVGIFLVGAIFILFIAVLSLREVNFLKGSYTLKIKFKFAEGLKPASPVRFCGVNVGEVKKVEVKFLNNQPQVYVYAKIRKDVKIPRNSQFFINSLSVFGEKYLEIMPPQKINSFLKENEEVEGISSTSLFNIMNTFYRTVIKIEKFIEEDEIRSSLKDIVLNVKEASCEFREILKGIRNEEGTIGKLIYDDTLYKEIEDLVKDLKKHPWKLLKRPRRR